MYSFVQLSRKTKFGRECLISEQISPVLNPIMSAEINIDKVCRLCMEETTLLLPIFNEGALLPQMIMALAEIQVSLRVSERNSL